MKTISFILFIILAFLIGHHTKATVWTVDVENFEFSNSPDVVALGDTIRWVWDAGSHTTTSTVVPAGALPWDVPITSTSQIFEYVVTVPGSYAYICIPHADVMNETFVALGSSSNVSTALRELFDLRVSNNTLYSSIYISNAQPISYSLYDITGKKVMSILNGTTAQGVHQIVTPLFDLPNGIYFAVLQADRHKRTGKVTINR